jgi:hypothetical protein
MYAMSYFRFVVSKMRKFENTKGRKIWTLSSLHVFAFSYFRDNKAKIRQKEGENTTHKICRIFAFHLSYFRFFAFKIQKCENTKRRQSITSHFRIVTFSHCCIFAFSHCNIFAFGILAFFHCYIFALLHFRIVSFSHFRVPVGHAHGDINLLLLLLFLLLLSFVNV